MKSKVLNFLVAIFMAAFSLQASEFSVEKIGITYVKSPLNIPSIIDKDKGFFKKAFDKYSLPVEYFELTAGPKQTQALAAGSLQFLNCVGGTSVILAASNGADIKIINAYSRAPKAFMIFSKDKKAKLAKDLKGKKIIGPKGTILHELLVRYLQKAGLSLKDVEFISAGIPQSLAALNNGSADFALLAGPAAYNAQKDGFSVLTTGEGYINPVIVVATSGKFYEKNKKLVEVFKNTQKQILNFLSKNEEESLKLTAKETGLSLEAVKQMYPMYNFDNTLTKQDIKSLEQTQDFMFENKMLQKKIDIKKLVLP